MLGIIICIVEVGGFKMTEKEKIEYCKDCKYFDGLYCIVGGGCFESDELEQAKGSHLWTGDYEPDLS